MSSLKVFVFFLAIVALFYIAIHANTIYMCVALVGAVFGWSIAEDAV